MPQDISKLNLKQLEKENDFQAQSKIKGESDVTKRDIIKLKKVIVDHLVENGVNPQAASALMHERIIEKQVALTDKINHPLIKKALPPVETSEPAQIEYKQEETSKAKEQDSALVRVEDAENALAIVAEDQINNNTPLASNSNITINDSIGDIMVGNKKFENTRFNGSIRLHKGQELPGMSLISKNVCTETLTEKDGSMVTWVLLDTPLKEKCNICKSKTIYPYVIFITATTCECPECRNSKSPKHVDSFPYRMYWDTDSEKDKFGYSYYYARAASSLWEKKQRDSKGKLLNFEGKPFKKGPRDVYLSSQCLHEHESKLGPIPLEILKKDYVKTVGTFLKPKSLKLLEWRCLTCGMLRESENSVRNEYIEREDSDGKKIAHPYRCPDCEMTILLPNQPHVYTKPIWINGVMYLRRTCKYPRKQPDGSTKMCGHTDINGIHSSHLDLFHLDKKQRRKHIDMDFEEYLKLARDIISSEKNKDDPDSVKNLIGEYGGWYINASDENYDDEELAVQATRYLAFTLLLEDISPSLIKEDSKSKVKYLKDGATLLELAEHRKHFQPKKDLASIATELLEELIATHLTIQDVRRERATFMTDLMNSRLKQVRRICHGKSFDEISYDELRRKHLKVFTFLTMLDYYRRPLIDRNFDLNEISLKEYAMKLLEEGTIGNHLKELENIKLTDENITPRSVSIDIVADDILKIESDLEKLYQLYYDTIVGNWKLDDFRAIEAIDIGREYSQKLRMTHSLSPHVDEADEVLDELDDLGIDLDEIDFGHEGSFQYNFTKLGEGSKIPYVEVFDSLSVQKEFLCVETIRKVEAGKTEKEIASFIAQLIDEQQHNSKEIFEDIINRYVKAANDYIQKTIEEIISNSKSKSYLDSNDTNLLNRFLSTTLNKVMKGYKENFYLKPDYNLPDLKRALSREFNATHHYDDVDILKQFLSRDGRIILSEEKLMSTQYLYWESKIAGDTPRIRQDKIYFGLFDNPGESLEEYILGDKDGETYELILPGQRSTLKKTKQKDRSMVNLF